MLLAGLAVVVFYVAAAGLVQASDGPFVAPLRTTEQLANEARALCRRAQSSRKPILVTLGADWCPDCRLMASLAQLPPLSTVLRRFEKLDVNVGQFDRHRDVIDAWGIRAISAWVVVTPPASCETPLTQWPRAAERTLEPASGGAVNPTELAAWLARQARPAGAPQP